MTQTLNSKRKTQRPKPRLKAQSHVPKYFGIARAGRLWVLSCGFGFSALSLQLHRGVAA